LQSMQKKQDCLMVLIKPLKRSLSKTSKDYKISIILIIGIMHSFYYFQILVL
jgi:hypothetical protein